jgi:hypothetical protein
VEAQEHALVGTKSISPVRIPKKGMRKASVRDGNVEIFDDGRQLQQITNEQYDFATEVDLMMVASVHQGDRNFIGY